LLAACSGGGGESAADADTTPSAELHIAAKGLKFDRKTLHALATTQVTVTLDNKDGVPHNFSVYQDKTAATVVFRGDVENDRKSHEYRFTSPSAGSYYFRCDVHPDMHGTLVVE
jgi:plastocyanin